ncbi:hypothetical protein ACPOLB_00270 [Rubrivivax sp. RP6-9]|uniref:hypothetical protein n=1 Tax=Rubrivivax sp. RP6-9 TaxID=3415750 RepID=UPI003CC675D4
MPILVCIHRPMHQAQTAGDPEQPSLEAVLACGCISVPQHDLQARGSNLRGAAVPDQALERIECSAMSSSSSAGAGEKTCAGAVAGSTATAVHRLRMAGAPAGAWPGAGGLCERERWPGCPAGAGVSVGRRLPSAT